MVLKQFKDSSRITLLYIGLSLLVLSYFFYQSLGFQLHDFSNSYFAAKLIKDGGSPNTLFSIYEFNSYIWDLGYVKELIDFYLNSPFTISFFYPFTFIEDPHLAKALFNGMGMVLFVGSVFIIIQKINPSLIYVLGLLPFLFFIPIRNQILFGQSYFLIFAFLVLGILCIENHKKRMGAGLLSIAVLLKIFPVFYAVILFFKKDKKSLLYGIISISILLIISVLVSGTAVWEMYLLEVLPNALQNNSTVDFRYNAQSMDVFLRTLFIEDSYYNPDAIFNNEQVYVLLKWLFKSIVIVIAISLSFKEKNNYFKLLSIWVVTLFLLQSRTATYAQILWIIPLVCLLNQPLSVFKKVLFVILLFLVCNMPVYQLQFLPIGFKFLRLWMSLLMAVLFFSSFSVTFNFKWFIGVLVVLLPLHLGIFKENNISTSTYVLNEKKYFMIYDFFEKEGTLFIKTLGRDGDQTINTHIPVSFFNQEGLETTGNQIKYNNKVILEDYSLKKKPVLINKTELYYLTDHHSRRGAYTLKKTTIETTP